MLLQPNIYKVVGNRGCNCYVVESRSGLVIIDVGLLGSDSAIKRYIELQLDSSLEDVTYIILTHGHRDVAEGLPDLLIYCPNAIVIMDGREVEIVRKITYMTEDMEIMKISDDTFIEDAGIHIIRTPGHTPGSISILYEKSLFIGGSIYIGPKGISLPRQNYDRGMLIESLKKLTNISFESIFPSHGRYIKSGAKTKFLDFLKTIAGTT